MIRNLCSITVTYNPILADGRLTRQLYFLKENCLRSAIVDNNSSNIYSVEELARNVGGNFSIHRGESNIGIAGALNLGIDILRNHDECEWVLLLDQDTIPLENSINEVNDEMERVNVHGVDLIALNYQKTRFAKMRMQNPNLIPVFTDSAITSGSIVRKRILEQIQFDSSLFMYYVDDDFCHRLKHFGSRILLSSKGIMDHAEGERIERGEYKYFCLEPKRFFYVGRNSFRMLFRYLDFKAIIYSIELLLENIIAGYCIGKTIKWFARGIFSLVDLLPE